MIGRVAPRLGPTTDSKSFRALHCNELNPDLMPRLLNRLNWMLTTATTRLNDSCKVSGATPADGLTCLPFKDVHVLQRALNSRSVHVYKSDCCSEDTAVLFFLQVNCSVSLQFYTSSTAFSPTSTSSTVSASSSAPPWAAAVTTIYLAIQKRSILSILYPSRTSSAPQPFNSQALSAISHHYHPQTSSLRRRASHVSTSQAQHPAGMADAVTSDPRSESHAFQHEALRRLKEDIKTTLAFYSAREESPPFPANVLIVLALVC